MALLTSQTHTPTALVPMIVSAFTMLGLTIFFYMRPQDSHNFHCPCLNKTSRGPRTMSYQGALTVLSVLGLQEESHCRPWCLTAQSGKTHSQQCYKISPIETGGKKDQLFPYSSLSSVLGWSICRAHPDPRHLGNLLRFLEKLLQAL